MAKEWIVNCKRCNSIDPNTGKYDEKRVVKYSDRMYQKMEEYGQSRPEYCDDCRMELLLEKMTMGAAYFSVKTNPGEDLSIALPGELGKVYHPLRPHLMSEKPAAFDASKFGATPDKIVDLYKWLNHKDHQVAIIIGETGSGKSTALPYWLMFPPPGVPDDFFIRDGQILITQPRIVATTSIADYMGVLLGSSVGKGFDIGYRYSKDRNADRFNAAFLATDGSLINMIMKGQLADLSVVMVDEAHERSTNIDIILWLLKEQLPLYPHLKVLIVSATINKELFLKHFGPETAKIIEFEAKRKFEYKRAFATEAEKLPYDNPSQLRNLLVPALVKKVTWLLEEQVAGRKIKGNVLAFLQGVKPIEEAISSLTKAIEANKNLKDKVEVYPLYSDLDVKTKDLALKGSGSDKIRVVVSTNVAEASVTPEGLVYVVETGVENQSNFKSETHETKISLTLISKANAKQRWGRSGRTAPGEVFCLYTEEQFNSMLDFPVAAIKRTSMEDIILLMKKLGIDDLGEGWIEAPDNAELSRSMAELRKNGAIDEDDMLTEYGAMLHDFAYTATLTDLIMMSDRFGCAVEIATILPVIKNGGHKHLLANNEQWDKKERQQAEKAHKILWKNCKDDVDFILKLYGLWLNPPGNKGKGKKLIEAREKWAKEFYVNHETLKEVDEERIQILQLLNARKKDRNFRDIEFGLLNRVRLILAYCLPYKEIAENEYAYKSSPVEPGSSASYRLKMPMEQKKAEITKSKTLSYFSLARSLIGLEQNIDSDAEYARLFEGTDLSLEEALTILSDDWQKQVAKAHPLEEKLEVSVRSVIAGGIFVNLPDKANGFIHVSEINKTSFVKDATKVVKVGEVLKAKVIGYDSQRQNLQMSLAIPENSPLVRHKVGETLEATVLKFEKFGTFVSLPLGYNGLIHISKMGQRVAKPEDLLSLGDLVSVEILSLAEENGKIKIGLKLNSVLKKA